MNKNKKAVVALSAVLALVLLCLAFLWIRYGGRQKEPYTAANYAMGSVVQQTLYGEKGEEAAGKAYSAISALENLISWREESSDIYRLNEQAGVDWCTLNDKTVALLEKALDVAQKSGGAFDPTVLPVSSLWSFDTESPALPEAAELESRLAGVNYQNLRVRSQEKQASLKYHDMGVDLGAIGKGAACDEAVEMYRANGLEAGIVAVGGSVGLYGQKAGGQPWQISVRDPNSGQSDEMGVLSLGSGFVSTSGSYEKTFTQDGKTYHHLLNPKTGYPEENTLLSVTVVCGNGALSDALATAAYVLGRDKGIALLKEYNADGVLIEKDNIVTVTDGLKDKFRLVGGEYSLAKG